MPVPATVLRRLITFHLSNRMNRIVLIHDRPSLQGQHDIVWESHQRLAVDLVADAR